MSEIRDRLAALSPEQRAKLWAKLGSGAQPEGGSRIPRRSAETTRLSFAQQRLWFLNQLDPQTSAYNVSIALRLAGPLDAEILRRTLETIVARHEALRTTFFAGTGDPVQRLSPEADCEWRTQDLSQVESDVREERARDVATMEGRRPFDLSRDPMLRALLLRLAENDHLLVLTMHHIASDGWSLGVLLREMGILYRAFHEGRDPSLPELAIQYPDFAEWQRAHLQGAVLEKELDYWRRRLQGSPILALPADHSRPAIQSYRGGEHGFKIPVELSERVRAVGREYGVTPALVVMAAFHALLHRYSGQSEVVVGQAVANRNDRDIEGLIGFFVNTLPIRSDFSDNPSFATLLGRLGRDSVAAYEHQDLPFEKMVEELGAQRDLSQNPVFQTIYAFQNSPLEELRLPGLTVSSFPLPASTTRLDLELHVWERLGALDCVLYYSTDLFEPSTIVRLADHFRHLLAGGLKDPRAPLSTVAILGAEEREQLLFQWNGTPGAYPRDSTIAQLFEEQVRQTPAASAVRFGEETLTYQQLNVRANRVAHSLRSLGVVADTPVGFCVERSVDMVVGMLAILKAGGAYVPLDPEYPAARLAMLLEDVDPPVIVSQSKFAQRLPSPRGRMLSLDDSQLTTASELNPVPLANPENLAYVMFTSGSTGRPKGVAVPHRGVVRLVKQTNYVDLTPSDVVLQFAPLSFDASTFEIWGSLLNGGTLVIAPPGTPSMTELGQIIKRERITTLWLTSALFQLMVDEQLESLRGVRQLIAGGDVLSPRHVQRALGALGENHRLINGYGPTENTTFTCCHVMNRSTRISEMVPIGRPVSNSRVYVLDSHQHPVPVGVPGELFVGGDGLAREYWRDPELTAAKFVSRSFGGSPGEERLYRTGDRVRWRPDGTLEFLGRLDNQVKLRGFRIELGEVETALLEQPFVREAACTVREDIPGDRRLVAYVVAKPSAARTNGQDATPAELITRLREATRSRLPAHLVPSLFVLLEHLPMSQNGKVDRASLPPPVGLASASEYLAPRTETEQKLAVIWQEVLHLERAGVHDHFFELGGHSLLATQSAVSRVRDVFGVEIPVASVFEGPTLGEIATVIERAGRDGTHRKTPAITRSSRKRPEPRRNG